MVLSDVVASVVVVSTVELSGVVVPMVVLSVVVLPIVVLSVILCAFCCGGFSCAFCSLNICCGLSVVGGFGCCSVLAVVLSWCCGTGSLYFLLSLWSVVVLSVVGGSLW